MRAVSISCAAAALACAAFPQSARADSGDGTFAYAVQSTSTSQAGTATITELLTLARNDGRSIVTVADSSGAALALPTDVLADGEIVANSGDPAVACYNNARTLLKSGDRTNAAGAVFVSFGSAVVRVAVQLRHVRDFRDAHVFTGTGSARFTATDEAARIPVHIQSGANVLATGDELDDASIETETFVGDPERLASRITCSLARLGTPALPLMPAAPLT